MAITTLNGVISGLQPPQIYAKVAPPTMVTARPQSLWGLGGQPAAGTPNATLNGATLTSLVTGQIPHYNPPGGTLAYLARFQLNFSATVSVAMLCDRLWDNQLATSNTSAQNITFPGLPSRDNAGTNSGAGILAGIEISATASSTAAALTNYTYTNQSGTGSHTGNFIDAPTAATTSAGQFFRLSLQTGDYGIRSIDSIQFSTAWTSGTVNMVLYRVLALLDSTVNTSTAVDAVTGAFRRLYDGTVPFVIIVPSGTAAPAVMGHYIETHG